MNGIRLDVGGKDQTAKTTHWIALLSALPQFWTSDVSGIAILTSKKLASKFSVYIYET